MLPRKDILSWLREADPRRLDALWRLADETRRRHVGDAVHLRGLVEVSTPCVRQCAYCGLRAANRKLTRYRLSDDEVLAATRRAVELGYGTVVLQAGEDAALDRDRVASLVRRIKDAADLAVTLSLGERPRDELRAWRDAGADRYLLRFETSNRPLYEQVHPPRAGHARYDRIEALRVLRELGYEVGSGTLVGLPGQTYDDVAADIEWFARLELDMIGVGPFLPHPATPLGHGEPARLGPGRQVPNDETTACKVVALTRLACPDANIPATTALATLDPEGGRESGLRRGANVVMPNLTPPKYRAYYEIYPAKACLGEDVESFHEELRRRIESVGRTVGTGRGDSPSYRRHAQAVCKT